MIYIKDLEEHFKKDFNTIINDKDIIFVADNVEKAIKEFIDYEEEIYNNYVTIETLEKIFIWLNVCTKDYLLNSELDTYERYFKVVDNGNIYYLNNIE